jgi:hypothetical protein
VALSTLAQIAATLAALIGFLALWKRDQQTRAMAQEEGTIRTLIAATHNPGPIYWPEVLKRAEEIVHTQDTTMVAILPELKLSLAARTTLSKHACGLQWALGLFLGCALGICLLAFIGLVPSPQPWGFLATRGFLDTAGGILMGSTLLMLVLMMLLAPRRS